MDALIRTALAGAFLALTGFPALAGDDPSAAIAAAEATGRAIFEHDRAAAVASDVAIAQPAFKRDGRVRGWLTEAKDSGIVVTFIDETPSALYRVLVSADGEPSPLLPVEAPGPLTEAEAGAALARRVALQSDFAACSKTYNTVVLPDASEEGAWVVYLLPGTTRSDEVPIGGTYRVEVRGGAVAAQRPFTRSCITLSRGSEGGAMILTHLLDPVPTEAHVHWSLWAGTPMYVGTSNGMWAIEEGRVRRLSEKDDD